MSLPHTTLALPTGCFQIRASRSALWSSDYDDSDEAALLVVNVLGFVSVGVIMMIAALKIKVRL